MQILGYDSMNSILLLGSLWSFAAIYMLMYFIYVVLKIVTLIRPTMELTSKFTNKLSSILMFSPFISLFLEGYIEYLIAMTMNLEADNVVWYNGEVIGYVSAQVIKVMLYGFVLGLTLHVIVASEETMSQPNFSSRYGLLINDVRPQRKLAKLYWYIYQMRRLIFVKLVFNPNVHGYQQIMFLTITNLCMLIYVGTDIFQEKMLRHFQMVEEFLNCIVVHHMFLFTDYCPHYEVQEVFGWSMIGIVSSYFLF